MRLLPRHGPPGLPATDLRNPLPQAKAKPAGQPKTAGMLPPSGSEDDEEDSGDDDGSDDESSEEAPAPAYLTQPAARKKWAAGIARLLGVLKGAPMRWFGVWEGRARRDGAPPLDACGPANMLSCCSSYQTP